MIIIYPRYKPHNRRYRVRVPKEKMPYEKKLFLRSICAFVIFAVISVASFFTPPKIIHTSLNTTYSVKHWHSFFEGTAKSITKGIQKGRKTYSSLLSKPQKSQKEIDVSAEKAQAKSEPKEIKTEVVPKVWVMPSNGDISSDFGEREHPINGTESLHSGIDIAGNEGDTVVAVSEGIVLSTGCDNANGNYVIVDHGDGVTSVYIHLKTISVTPGEYVSPEIKIGEIGSTGISTGPHLHFEIKKDGKSVNPREYIVISEG